MKNKQDQVTFVTIKKKLLVAPVKKKNTVLAYVYNFASQMIPAKNWCSHYMHH